MLFREPSAALLFATVAAPLTVTRTSGAATANFADSVFVAVGSAVTPSSWLSSVIQFCPSLLASTVQPRGFRAGVASFAVVNE